MFKSVNGSLAQNYRPISILPAFSNIFERAVYNRIFQFLVDNDILFKHQFVSSFMYLYHNDASPISFTQIFQTGNQIHQYSIRYSGYYRPHTCRTNI